MNDTAVSAAITESDTATQRDDPFLKYIWVVVVAAVLALILMKSLITCLYKRYYLHQQEAINRIVDRILGVETDDSSLIQWSVGGRRLRRTTGRLAASSSSSSSSSSLFHDSNPSNSLNRPQIRTADEALPVYNVGWLVSESADASHTSPPPYDSQTRSG
ncbi:hypothetical protein BDR26DRAFT_849325 [Obelidium mucronatum]|nr:hypothetical protein BDR26DRAFT_849325 [Obelidium mucronatum]